VTNTPLLHPQACFDVQILEKVKAWEKDSMGCQALLEALCLRTLVTLPHDRKIFSVVS